MIFRHPHDTLTPREHEVMQLLKEGYTNKEIAARLLRRYMASGQPPEPIREHTIEAHLKSIYAKLDVGNRVRAIRRYDEIYLMKPL